MPVDLMDLMTRRTRKVVIPIGPEADDTVTVTYKPDAYTKGVEAKIQAANSELAVAKGVAEALNAVLDSWDLTSGKEPYPMTPENVEALGLSIGQTIWNAINADFTDANAKKI